MRIDPTIKIPQIAAYQNSKAKKTEKIPVSGGVDVASVSEDAKSFSRILSELRENETIRSPKELERIREITSLVNRGAYQADSRAIADRILSAYAAADEDI